MTQAVWSLSSNATAIDIDVAARLPFDPVLGAHVKITLDCYASARRAGEHGMPLGGEACREAGLDGFEETDVEIAPYLDDPLIVDEGITDAGVRYWLDKKGDLHATVSFTLVPKLSSKQLQALASQLEGQLLDGWGEGHTVQTPSGGLAITWFEHRGKADTKFKVKQVDNRKAVPDRRTPSVVKAAEKGNAAAVKAAIDGGANINARGAWGMTALMLAARDEHVECVDLLLQGGADINVLSESGATALTLASMSGNEAIAKALIAAGASLSLGDKSPLHWAANRRHEGLVRILLAAGADMTARDERGSTALFLTYSPEIIRILVEAGADTGFRNPRGQTALESAREQLEWNERTKWDEGVRDWQAAVDELQRWTR